MTLTNTGLEDLHDVRYMRDVDPDNTVDMYGSFTTINSIDATIAAGDSYAAVSARSFSGDYYYNLYGKQTTFVYFSTDKRCRVGYGAWYTSIYGTFTYDLPMSKGTNDVGDEEVYITFDVGTLKPGASATLTYYTALEVGAIEDVLATLQCKGALPTPLAARPRGQRLTPPPGAPVSAAPKGRYCPPGSQTDAPCPVGFICAGGPSQPALCPAGTYCPVSGSPSPKTCPCGYYCPEGSSAPTSCPAGSYCPISSGAPLLCPGGKYCQAGACQYAVSICGYYAPPGTSMPLPCPKGSYCPANTSAPVPCPPGTQCRVGAAPAGGRRWAQAGLCQSSPCSAGFYCPNSTTIISCQCGSYCPRGSSAPSQCQVGTYCPAQTTAPVTCQPGQYCPRPGMCRPSAVPKVRRAQPPGGVAPQGPASSPHSTLSAADAEAAAAEGAGESSA